ncbi:Protein CBG25789 [Caenorhabditis briggsae]|uniref:Protein CBG25789 n=1 Tax=Caenorhabditis briggsae TaxID=6238 RepID=B6IGL2_CAEBR|nr:Protein CBG25789 [Caenorhabditis briggsae]CAR99042.1 Protein CBG25789 [Caenorhabditis briggsae]
MNSAIIFSLFAIVGIVMSDSFRRQLPDDINNVLPDLDITPYGLGFLEAQLQVVNALQHMESPQQQEHRIAKSRLPRGFRLCGATLNRNVLDFCGEPCQAGGEIDIATLCCSRKCTLANIKEACCP